MSRVSAHARNVQCVLTIVRCRSAITAHMSPWRIWSLLVPNRSFGVHATVPPSVGSLSSAFYRRSSPHEIPTTLNGSRCFNEKQMARVLPHPANSFQSGMRIGLILTNAKNDTHRLELRANLYGFPTLSIKMSGMNYDIKNYTRLLTLVHGRAEFP